MIDMIAAVSYDRQSAKEAVKVLPNILLVEDNLTNQRLALVQLKWLGFRAEAVDSGKQAMQAIVEKQFDLILMDCNMPGMDGFESTRQIRDAETVTGLHIP